MFMTIARPAVEPAGPDAVAVPGAPRTENPTPRALHARLLDNAALRRRRGMQRRAETRLDDAEYWMSAAFTAVSKATQTRLQCLAAQTLLP